jgi:hypothetical protein
MERTPETTPDLKVGDALQSSNPGFATKNAAVIVGAAYLVMLLCIWSPFAATSGMGWETYYTIRSESATSWENFLYTPDPLRIHAANFYELAYRLGDLLGIRGSFFPYQLVYAVLWWARSFLGFLIIRRLFPASLVLPFVIGAIMLVHAPDVLLGWLGQLHQFGYFLWLLAAIYLFIKALQAKSVSKAIRYTVATSPFVYLCLWTYEGPLFIIAVTPFVLVFLVRPKPIRFAIWPSVLWYLVPLVYVFLSLQRYLHLGGSPYQQSLLRKSFEPTAILSDWFFNVWYSLSFWSWLHVDAHLSDGQIFVPTALLLLAFLAAGLFLARREIVGSQPFLNQQVFRLLLSGLVLLFLSFPSQLLLEAARQPRRTQLLSAIAASMVLGAAIVLIAETLPYKRFRSVIAIGLTVPIMGLGSWRTIEREGGHRAEWNAHLPAMKQLLRTVPRVKEGTIVVMTNVPRLRTLSTVTIFGLTTPCGWLIRERPLRASITTMTALPHQWLICAYGMGVGSIREKACRRLFNPRGATKRWFCNTTLLAARRKCFQRFHLSFAVTSALACPTVQTSALLPALPLPSLHDVMVHFRDCAVLSFRPEYYAGTPA